MVIFLVKSILNSLSGGRALFRLEPVADAGLHILGADFDACSACCQANLRVRMVKIVSDFIDGILISDIGQRFQAAADHFGIRMLIFQQLF